MKCYKCRFDNRDGVKFCKECGAKMELNCPNCRGSERSLNGFAYDNYLNFDI